MLREQKKTIKYIEKKKVADKIKEDKKQMKEDEKRRKLEEQREAYRQEQIKKRIDREEFTRMYGIMWSSEIRQNKLIMGFF